MSEPVGDLYRDQSGLDIGEVCGRSCDRDREGVAETDRTNLLVGETRCAPGL